MVSGKPSNQSARGVDFPPPHVFGSFGYLVRCVGIRVAGQPGVRSCSRATGVRPALWKCVWSYSHLWWSDPRVGMKGKRLLRNDPLVFQACVLGLPLQG
jgi:hypothetical protein